VTENNIIDLAIVQRERKGKFVLFGELSTDANKEWLITGLLGHAELSVIYGHPGSGKSVFAADAALRIAAGWEVHGRPVRRGAVLYVALERYSLVKRRAIAFRIKHGVSELPFAMMGGVLDLRDSLQAQAIVAVAKEVEAATGESIVLIVIDTLSRALAGGDENSPKDMGAIVKSTAIIGQGTGAHVQFVHHMPKESESMRGHGALLGAADTTILVSKGTATRTATVVKANDSQEGETISFTLESVSVGTDGETTAPVVVTAEHSEPRESGEKLSRNLQTMFSLLHEAGQAGLTVEKREPRA
jgi:RecA-family ATPase